MTSFFHSMLANCVAICGTICFSLRLLNVESFSIQRMMNFASIISFRTAKWVFRTFAFMWGLILADSFVTLHLTKK